MSDTASDPRLQKSGRQDLNLRQTCDPLTPRSERRCLPFGTGTPHMVAHRVMSEMPALDSLPDKLRKLLAKALYVRLTVRWGGAGRVRRRVVVETKDPPPAPAPYGNPAAGAKGPRSGRACGAAGHPRGGGIRSLPLSMTSPRTRCCDGHDGRSHKYLLRLKTKASRFNLLAPSQVNQVGG